MILNENFVFSRPLTVTGAFLLSDDTILFHQMVLDRVDDSSNEYIIQNSDFDRGTPVMRIPKAREYYANEEVMLENNIGPGEFKYKGPNGECMSLVNEDFGDTMKSNKWYLLPQAYSITLVPRKIIPAAIHQVPFYFVREFSCVKQIQNPLMSSAIESARMQENNENIGSYQQELVDQFLAVRYCLKMIIKSLKDGI